MQLIKVYNKKISGMNFLQEIMKKIIITFLIFTALIVYCTDNINAGPPNLSINKIQVSPIGDPEPGSNITYRIDYSNAGGTASNIIIIDRIPDYTTYVAGSMSNELGINFTDDTNGDEGCFDSVSNRVIFCVTNGQAPSTGGTLESNASGSLYFTVQVDSLKYLPITNYINFTNKDNSFDGVINESLIVNTNTNLQAGDLDANGNGDLVTNTNYLLQADRDHSIQKVGGGSITLREEGVFRVGDWSDGAGSERYGFLTFGLGDIPTNATIISADLNLWLVSLNAEGTYDDPMNIDNVVYGNVYTNVAATLPGRMWCNAGGRSVIQSNMVQVNSGTLTPGQYNTFDVTSGVVYCMTNLKLYQENGSYRILQMRLRDSIVDYTDAKANLTFAVYGSGTPPYLKVTYTTNAIGAPNDEVRSLIAFDLSSIPDNATVVDADLNVNAFQVDGASNDIQPIEVWHVDYSNSIEGSDFNPPSVNGGMYNSFGPTATGWRSIDSTAQVEYAHTNAKSWQKNGSSNWFQVQFRPAQTNSDGISDMQWIYGASQGSDYPYLEVTFTTDILAPMPDTITNQVCITGNNFLTTCATASLVVDDCPEPPAGLSADMIGTNLVMVIWNAVPFITGYTLFRSPNNDTNTAVSITYLNYDYTNYMDTISTNKTYYYWLKSYHEYCTEGSRYSDAGWNEPGADIILSKTKVSPITDPEAGSNLTYRIDYTNAGGVAFNVRIVEDIPEFTTYQPGTMSNSVGSNFTDASNDDAGYYNSANDTLIFHVGSNGQATNSAGTLGSGEFGSFYFTVQIASNKYQPVTNYINFTNKDNSFDGVINASGIVDVPVSERVSPGMAPVELVEESVL